MLINLCPITDKRKPYFKENKPAKVCSAIGVDEGEWQFEHYKLPPIKTYHSPYALYQAHMRGEYAKPHISAYKPDSCTDGLSCGTVEQAIDIADDEQGRNDLIHLSNEDKCCRRVKVLQLVDDLAKVNGGIEEPMIRLCEPVPDICPAQSIEVPCDVVGLITPLSMKVEEDFKGIH